MTVEKNKVCSVLKAIAEQKCDESIKFEKITISGISDDIKETVFIILSFYGAVKLETDSFRIVSESARLFIKSYAEYLTLNQPLYQNWSQNCDIIHEVTEENYFDSSKFLHLFERRRKKDCGELARFNPVFKGTNVRAIIVRNVWGRKRYLMQYSNAVGKYQLIGGMLDQNKTEQETLKDKLKAETPELFGTLNDKDYSLREEYRSLRPDEEVIYSRKLNVYALYKTVMYSVSFHQSISKDTLKNLAKNKDNRWVTIKEIENDKARDGKDIFPLEAIAIKTLKEKDPVINAWHYEIGKLIDETWFRWVLAIIAITGVSLVSAFTNVVKWIVGLFN